MAADHGSVPGGEVKAHRGGPYLFVGGTWDGRVELIEPDYPWVEIAVPEHDLVSCYRYEHRDVYELRQLIILPPLGVIGPRRILVSVYVLKGSDPPAGRVVSMIHEAVQEGFLECPW